MVLELSSLVNMDGHLYKMNGRGTRFTIIWAGVCRDNGHFKTKSAVWRIMFDQFVNNVLEVRNTLKILCQKLILSSEIFLGVIFQNSIPLSRKIGLQEFIPAISIFHHWWVVNHESSLMTTPVRITGTFSWPPRKPVWLRASETSDKIFGQPLRIIFSGHLLMVIEKF